MTLKVTHGTLGLETLKIVTTPSGAVEVWFMNRIIAVQPSERDCQSIPDSPEA